MTDMKGRVALVTGGGTGIGRATAIAFAQAGATVVVTGRREAEGQETVDLIAAEGLGKGVFVQADVADAASVAALFERIERDLGRLDYAFNNAGVVRNATVIEATEADFDLMVGTNLKGVWLCLKHELPIMLRQGAGSIVITASVLGKIGRPGTSIYGATKAGVESMARAAAMEVATSGIRINAICPAIIQTPMTQGAFGGAESVEANLGPLHPIGRVGRPEEVSGAVVWLCSDAASFITGESINIDGGLIAQ